MGIGLDFVKQVDKNWKDRIKPIEENVDIENIGIHNKDIKTKMIVSKNDDLD